MAITDIPLLGMLRTRMDWHQERQRLLSENVANADTPKFRPRDLAPPQFGKDADRSPASSSSRTAVEPHRRRRPPAASSFGTAQAGGYDVRPSGNAVNLEDEMIKVAVEPDGLPGGDHALHAQPRPAQDRDRQALKPGTRSDNRRRTAVDFLKSIAIAASGLARAGRPHAHHLREHRQRRLRPRRAAGADPYRRKIPTFSSEIDRTLDAPRGHARPGAARSDGFPPRSTSRDIRPPTPTATSNIPTSIRWSK